MSLDKIWVLVASAKYGTLIIFRYNFNWGSLSNWTWSGLILTVLLTYCLMAWSDIVSSNYYTFTVNAYEVSHNARFDVFKDSVDIHNMSTQILDEANDAVIIYRDDYLFAWRFLGYHIQLGFGLVLSIDNFLSYFNLFVLKLGESFFDLKYVSSYIRNISRISRCLCVGFFCGIMWIF